MAERSVPTGAARLSTLAPGGSLTRRLTIPGLLKAARANIARGNGGDGFSVTFGSHPVAPPGTLANNYAPYNGGKGLHISSRRPPPCSRDRHDHGQRSDRDCRQRSGGRHRGPDRRLARQRLRDGRGPVHPSVDTQTGQRSRPQDRPGGRRSRFDAPRGVVLPLARTANILSDDKRREGLALGRLAGRCGASSRRRACDARPPAPTSGPRARRAAPGAVESPRGKTGHRGVHRPRRPVAGD
jgi:hypothetical protein